MPTQDDKIVRQMQEARQNQIRGLTEKLERLASEWSAAKLANDKDEERTIFNEMKQVQSEIKHLEKMK